MRKLLQLILKFLSIIAIKRYDPLVIGITGSAGKTTVKEAVYALLSEKIFTRKNPVNFNNEIGVPMAVLGLEKVGKLVWFRNIIKSFWLCFGPRQKYPAVLVLELAADKPGDICYLTKITKPTIGIVTAVGETPVHVEFYASPKEVAKEKSYLIKNLPPTGLAVLNYDDLTVFEMKEIARSNVLTFGFSKDADIYASDLKYLGKENDEILGSITFKLNYNKSYVPVRIKNTIGAPIAYSFLAASAVGIRMGMNLVEIAQILSQINSLPPSRMNLMRGIKNSVIIDDTYNASPIAMHRALEALNEFFNATYPPDFGREKGRRIAVLGDMKELGKYTIGAHQSIGNIAGENCDILITVGSAAKFIAEAARNQMSEENIREFNTSAEAAKEVQKIIKEGDIILIKGSRSMKMEEVVEEIIYQS